jgi:hypothetical protein
MLTLNQFIDILYLLGQKRGVIHEQVSDYEAGFG